MAVMQRPSKMKDKNYVLPKTHFDNDKLHRNQNMIFAHVHVIILNLKTEAKPEMGL